MDPRLVAFATAILIATLHACAGKLEVLESNRLAAGCRLQVSDLQIHASVPFFSQCAIRL